MAPRYRGWLGGIGLLTLLNVPAIIDVIENALQARVPGAVTLLLFSVWLLGCGVILWWLFHTRQSRPLVALLPRGVYVRDGMIKGMADWPSIKSVERVERAKIWVVIINRQGQDPLITTHVFRNAEEVEEFEQMVKTRLISNPPA
jgi:hypothetical protein